jgi:uncharacterized membrane protein
MTPDADQPTPPNSPESAAVTPLPEASGTGLQPQVAAGLACIFLLLGGIVFLILEKKDKFVRFYAMQSVFLGGAGLALSIFLQIAGAILRLIPILGKIILFLLSIGSALAGIGLLALWVILIVKAFSHQEWEIPFLGPLARKQLESGKPGAA